jgi:beta-glucosidase
VPPTTDDVLRQLSTEEKVLLLSGGDVWRTRAVERVGLPAVKVTDGPNGARGDSTTGARSVCLPASICLASTFDPRLVRDAAHLLGRETQRKGAHVLLAPTINLARHPIGGRNFESFGEDPFLTGTMAVAYVEGVQEVEGVGACAKHFVANDVEYARMTVSSEIDERTLREVYLAPFEAAVAAGVWSLMASYPKLNGQHCTEHRWLLTDLLREEWGFDGLVMSDWGATHHHTRPVTAGMDLEMPGPPRALGDRLLAAVEAGEVAVETIDARARRVIDLAVRAGRMGRIDEQPEQSVDLPEDRASAREFARRGVVLIRNEEVDGRPALPLDPDSVVTLAVLGPNADPGIIQGGGSAELPAHHVISPVDGLSAAFREVTTAPGCRRDRYLPLVPAGSWVSADERPVALDVYEPDDFQGEPVSSRSSRGINAFLMSGVDGVSNRRHFSNRWRGTLQINEAGTHRFSVLSVGPSRVLVEGEVLVDNWTSPTPGDAFFQRASAEVVGSIDLDVGTVEIVVEWTSDPTAMVAGLRFGWLPPTDDDELMADAVAAAASADAAIVVVGLDADWETEGHDRPIFGLPGRQDELVRRVAATNPRTIVVLNAGGPVDLPWFDDVAAVVVGWYGGQEFGGALADVLSGAVDASGRLPVTFPKRLADAPTALDVPGDGGLLHYREGLFVGHRWYDARDIDPLVEFGFGLSYTTFEFGPPTVSAQSDGGVVVSLRLTNSGSRSGRAVPQLYLEPPRGSATRPRRSLCGFTSVELDAGTSTEVSISVSARSFQIWNDEAGWHTPGGEYRIHVASSSRQLRGAVSLER